MIVPSCGRLCFSVDNLQIEEERCGYFVRFKLHTFCLGLLTTPVWVPHKIQATHLLSGIADHTGVGTSQDSSYTAPVNGSLFHCQWPPNFIGKTFFSRKIGSLFHEKLVPNIINKNKPRHNRFHQRRRG